MLIIFSTMLMVQKSTFIPIVVAFFCLSFYSKRHQVDLFKKCIVLTLLLFSVSYSLIVGSNVNSNWQVSYSGQTLLWQLGGQSPVATEFATYLKEKGSPQCIFSEAPFQNIDLSIGKILNDCPEGVDFIKTGIQEAFIDFLASNPGSAAELIVLGAGASSTNSASNYGGAVSVVPDFVSKLFFGTTAPNITDSKVEDQVEGMNLIKAGSPIWIFSPIFGWLILTFFSFFFSKCRNREDFMLHLALLFILLQSALVVVLLPSEWVRQTSPYTTGILVLCLFLTARTVSFIFDSKSKNGS